MYNYIIICIVIIPNIYLYPHTSWQGVTGPGMSTTYLIKQQVFTKHLLQERHCARP